MNTLHSRSSTADRITAGIININVYICGVNGGGVSVRTHADNSADTIQKHIRAVLGGRRIATGTTQGGIKGDGSLVDKRDKTGARKIHSAIQKAIFKPTSHTNHRCINFFVCSRQIKRN